MAKLGQNLNLPNMARTVNDDKTWNTLSTNSGLPNDSQRIPNHMVGHGNAADQIL